MALLGQTFSYGMARKGTWADNKIIQSVANSLNVTTGTQFNLLFNWTSVTKGMVKSTYEPSGL